MQKNMQRADRDIVDDAQVVVLMGGLGTRLGLKRIPKAMADVNGCPFFDYQLTLLKRWGFHRFLFLVGYQAGYIEAYYGDGSEKGVDIQYSYDGTEQLGTGGALKKAEEKLDEDFLLIYGDSFMDIDYQETIYRYQVGRETGRLGVMAILRNEGRWDKSNIIYQDGKFLLYDKVNFTPQMRYIDYGVLMLSKEVLSEKKKGEVFDLAELLTDLSKSGKLSAQVVTKRFFEIGSPRALAEFCDYAEARFDRSGKAVFFDRDGVVNEIIYNDYTEQLDSPFRKEDFIYREGIIEMLLMVQKAGYYIFIVTNQPAAAKGNVPLARLYDLNTWMIQDLASKGIEIEFVNMCPHHPVGSPRTKAPFLIKKCDCRKPGAGLVKDLMKVYNITPERSYMIGDSYTDVIAGKKAGLKTILLGDLKCDACHHLKGQKPDWIVSEIAGLKKILGEGTEDV